MSFSIQYLQPGIRILGKYTWDDSNDRKVAVDSKTAAELITYPEHRGKQFAGVPGAKPTAEEWSAFAGHLNVSVRDAKRMWKEFANDEVALPTELGDIVGERLAEFEAAGVPTVAALAALEGDALKAAVSAVGASKSEVVAWVKEAQAHI